MDQLGAFPSVRPVVAKFHWEKPVMTKFFVEMLRDEDGASAAEYALILAIVTTGIAGSAVALGNAIGNAIDQATTCISTAGSDCGTP